MIQLTYQPALDPFHTVFRLLRLRRRILANKTLEIDHVRILDFYLLFPFRCAEIRLYPEHRKYKLIAKRYLHTSPYGGLPDSRTIFNRMSSIQTAALDTLAKKRLIVPREYAKGFVAASNEALPSALDASTRTRNEAQADLMEFLATLATEYPLLGTGGLKHRSGLMEHAYDAA